MVGFSMHVEHFLGAHDILIDSCYNCYSVITMMRRKCPLLVDTILGVILMREMKKSPINKKVKTHPSKVQGK
jgi:hypothetical protein